MPTKTGKAVLDDSSQAILDDSGQAILDDSTYTETTGKRFRNMSAAFEGGSSVYSMRIGDDARETVILLSGTNYEEPQSATLRIKTNSTTISKTLTHDEDGTEGEWYCGWTVEEIAAIGAGTHRAEVLAVFADGTQTTFPTAGKLTIKVLPVI